MSVTVQDIRERVQTHTRELGLREMARDSVEYDNAIAEAIIMLAGRLPAPVLYTANAGAISAGASSFLLPATAPDAGASPARYAGGIGIQIASTGQFLVKQSRDQLFALRNRAPIIPTGHPQFYTPAEEWQDGADSDAPHIVCEIYPRAQAAEPYNLYRKMLTEEIREFSDLGTFKLPYSTLALGALTLKAACLIAEGLTDDDLKARRLNGRVTARWDKECERLLYAEEKRRHNLASTGQQQRWD